MPRIRTIKPEFWANEFLCSLPESTHFFAAALLNHCDDQGFFNANPQLLKASIYPIREPSLSIHGMLSELSNIDYLRLYKGSDGRTYGHVVKFTTHQKVNRPSPSKIKDLIDFTESSLNPHGVLTAGKERKGKEQGKERKVIKDSGKPKSSLPDFDTFWKSCSTEYKRIGHNIGAKKDAQKEFNKLKPDQQKVMDWVLALSKQVDNKLELESNGQFAEQLKHLCRWLSHERFNDDILPVKPKDNRVVSFNQPPRRELKDFNNAD